MKELLKILKFDCELERFAEVFGEDIENEDISEFLKVAPLEPADLEKVDTTPLNGLYVPDEPDFKFYVLDMATQDRLHELREAETLEPADLLLLRTFFRFVNDSYGWGDLADLERWETDLFDSLNGYQQKNYKPLDLGEDAESRNRLLNKFVAYIAETVGKFNGVEVVRDCLDLVREEIKGEF